ncbi:MAG: hypothetical protein KIT83_18055, partial [Bryobacterales bacterium]|nr:hypothetical protein [Bryobacterales bacterium]
RLLVQQRHAPETLAFQRLLDAVPGLIIEHFDQASELVRRLADARIPAVDAIVSSAGALAVWDDLAVQALRKMGSAAPPLILLRDSNEESTPLRHPVLETVDLDPPVLPSHLLGLLKKLRHSPLGPLFEAAGMTAFDLFPDRAPPRLRNGVLLLANDNPVELLRLEGIARKLGMEWRSSTSTRDLAHVITTETVSAAVVQASLLTTEAQVAFWRTTTKERQPLRLLVTGTVDSATRAQLSASPVAYQLLPESPRLAQLRDALNAAIPTSPGGSGRNAADDDRHHDFSEG